ncbi:hypothetical protein C8F01DRAFT_1076264 [Mycena amicta]|nr:hypothetical protein C8F01DRAFT_1076264 [Mycena amicta]
MSWASSNQRLADDKAMSSRVDLHTLGAAQRLLFRNIRVGTNEISTLLDCTVLRLLPSCGRFTSAPPPLTDAVEFRPSGGSKGYGAFAVNDIHAAALIHVEYPAIVCQNTIVLNFEMSSPEIYRELVRRVPEKRRSSLMALCNSQPGLEPEEAIIRTNAIGISLPVPASHGSTAMGHNAVFLQASRFNHSCAPNAIHRFDPNSFTLTIHALRPITKGEEIFISYIDLTSTPTREARRAICRTSIISPAAAQFVLSPPPPLKTAMPVGSVSATAIEDMTTEGLHYRFRYFLHLLLLAGCYAALMDTRNFRLWLGKARDVANSSYLAVERDGKDAPSHHESGDLPSMGLG